MNEMREVLFPIKESQYTKWNQVLWSIPFAIFFFGTGYIITETIGFPEYMLNTIPIVALLSWAIVTYLFTQNLRNSKEKT